MFRWHPREQAVLALYALRWFCLAAPVGLIVGSACALFLWSLEKATDARLSHPGLLFLLPLAGVAIALLYEKLGRGSEGGNNLLLDEIHEPGGGVPRRMGLLVLVATVITHLFGGSAGREGTAVQMGGSVAAAVGRMLRLGPAEVRTLLLCGIAAGFGGVFGTPLTGAVFAMEVLAVGRMSYEAIIPCLIAAVLGDWTCGAWGVHHTRYAISPGAIPTLAGEARFDWFLAAKVALASIAFGLASVLFAELIHGVQHLAKRIRWSWARPLVGGLCVVALTYALGTRDYLGLGVSSPDPRAVTIVSSFSPDGAGAWSWWWKLLFTAITLGSGFKGGEVTPLFFVGATLGNTLGKLMHAPVDLFAGLGFVAIFAGATNTPLACTLMGIELFGAQYTVYFMIACFLSYLFSGHSGIYTAQRVSIPKHELEELPQGATLRSLREKRPSWALPFPGRGTNRREAQEDVSHQ